MEKNKRFRFGQLSKEVREKVVMATAEKLVIERGGIEEDLMIVVEDMFLVENVWFDENGNYTTITEEE